MVVAELTILDLRCGCCADHIESVLRSEPAIARAEVSFPRDLVKGSPVRIRASASLLFGTLAS
jgi:copper chaperone CopZ